MSQKEYAGQQGFSPQYVHKLVRSGLIVLTGRFVDPQQANEALAAIRRPEKPLQRKGRPVSAQAPSPRLQSQDSAPAGAEREREISLSNQLLLARIRREQERVLLTQFQRRKREGELVEASQLYEGVASRNGF